MNENISKMILPMSDEFRDYLHDETKTVGKAENISFPKSEEDIRSIVSHFSALGEKVTVQGNRTGLTAASVPSKGHIMSLSLMDKVTGMRIDDEGTVYIKVQPGLSLGLLRQMIASRSFPCADWSEESLAAYELFKKLPAQYFPPDPTESSASIGGMAACNSSGAKTFRYGPTRPYISALRLVLTDGDLISLSRGRHFAKGREFELTTEKGRIIKGTLPSYTMPRCKNASGYYIHDDMDLLDIFIGSDGTLGIMSEIELRLIAMPRAIWGVNCFFRSEAQAVDFVEDIRANIEGLAAIEYFDGNALEILRGHDNGGCKVPSGFACMIYAEIHCGDEQEALEQVKALGRSMDAAGADCADTWAAKSLPDRERLLELRHKVPESVNALIAKRKREIPTLAKVGSDMAVADDKFRQVLEMYHRDLEKNGFQFAVWGHIGNNHLHVNVLPRSAQEMAQGKAMFMDWAKEVTALGGTVSAEHGAGKSKANMLPILYGDEGVREMARLKSLFDPECILGAGNLFPESYV